MIHSNVCVYSRYQKYNILPVCIIQYAAAYNIMWVCMCVCVCVCVWCQYLLCTCSCTVCIQVFASEWLNWHKNQAHVTEHMRVSPYIYGCTNKIHMFGTHYTTIAYNTCVYVTLYTPLTRYCRWYICSAILSLILELCVSSRRWGSSWSGCFYLALGRCSPLYPTLRRRRRGSLLVTNLHGYLHVREEEGGGEENIVSHANGSECLSD